MKWEGKTWGNCEVEKPHKAEEPGLSFQVIEGR